MRPWLIALLFVCTPLAWAVDATSPFPDPAQQARYERLVRDLRCLVCQNESVADSNAMLAADLRREVRDLMVAGKSDDEIRAFMTERYGDFVLYRPPLVPRTWLLWATPALFLAAALFAVFRIVSRRARAARADPAALDEEADRP
jgi:cytochrome c-type biogenesis protein CcmH